MTLKRALDAALAAGLEPQSAAMQRASAWGIRPGRFGQVWTGSGSGRFGFGQVQLVRSEGGETTPKEEAERTNMS